MKFSSAIPAIFLLAGNSIVAALPTCGGAPPSGPSGRITADIIAAIAPTSTSCSDTTDCRTNVQVAPLLDAATSKFNVGTVAAIISLTAFETADYKYKHNVFPGRPGQGTCNMQMAEFNIQYAESFPELQPKVTALGTIDTDEKKNQVLALVTDDKYNFGSATWYIDTHCPEIVSQLESASDSGFAAYMACIGTENTADRIAYWTRAKTAFGLH